MNSLERYLKTIKGEPVDHLARHPILIRYAAEFIHADYNDFIGDYRTLTKSHMECARVFGIDQMNTMSDAYREADAFGAEVIYGPGLLPHINKFPLENTTDLNVLQRPNPLKSRRMLDRVEAIRAYRAALGNNYSVMGWVEGPLAEAADLRGAEAIFMDLYDDPGFCSELMSLCVDVALDFAKAQVEAGADTIGVGDALASQISSDLYEKHVLPHEQRLVKGIQALGAKVRLHICGDITRLLPGIGSLHVDVLDVDYMVDIQYAREQVGRNVCLGGNIDPVWGVFHGTPESIRAKIRELYQQAGNPFIVNAGCEIPPGTPVENLKALCEPVSFKA